MENDERTGPSECPFLGYSRDRSRVYSYPTDLNACHAQKSFRRRFKIGPRKYRNHAHISRKKQRDCCLVRAMWVACQHYKGGMQDKNAQGGA